MLLFSGLLSLSQLSQGSPPQTLVLCCSHSIHPKRQYAPKTLQSYIIISNPRLHDQRPHYFVSRPSRISSQSRQAYGYCFPNFTTRIVIANTFLFIYSSRLCIYWLFPAESTFARRSAAVLPVVEKNREKTGWMTDRKTTWAPLVIGSAIQRTRMNLKT